jgi:hypothetical protein
MTSTAFFAYPSGRAVITDAIRGAADLSIANNIKLKPWEKLNVVGFKLDDLIREQIRDSDFLAADITYPNFNVLYEIGYAISVGKPILTTVNTAVDKGTSNVIRLGLFDTIGWASYNNAEELNEQLKM